MKQIIAIFMKDARRFWPELLISFAILIAFVFVYPSTWQAVDGPPVRGSIRFFGSTSPMGILAGCLVVLIPVSWWILIARLIHGERLVGDNQFWLTRPYEWPKFLGAKLLFLVVFLYIPFFLAQCALLAEGGFHPFSYLPGLLYNLLLLTGVLVLPLAAISAITTGFGRMTLVILGIILFIGGVALIYSLLPSDFTSGVSGPLADNLSFAFIFSGCAAVVLVQYALRNARLGWALIAVVAVLLSGLAFFDPDQALMNRRYPAQDANATPFVQFSYAAKGVHQTVASEAEDKGVLDVTVPVEIAGVPDGYAAGPVAVRAAIEVPGGERWESVWQSMYGEHALPGTLYSPVHFKIRRTIYDKFKSKPITLRLTLAIDQAKAGVARSIPLPDGEFTVPEFGICTPQKPFYTSPVEITGITCRSAMRQPQLTYVTARWSDDDCLVPEQERETVLATDWSGSFDTDPAEFGITSVWETPLNLSNSWRDYHQGESPRLRQLCPGSALTFTAYDRVARAQTVLTIQDFHLPEIAHQSDFRLLLR